MPPEGLEYSALGRPTETSFRRTYVEPERDYVSVRVLRVKLEIAASEIGPADYESHDQESLKRVFDSLNPARDAAREVFEDVVAKSG